MKKNAAADFADPSTERESSRDRRRRRIGFPWWKKSTTTTSNGSKSQIADRFSGVGDGKTSNNGRNFSASSSAPSEKHLEFGRPEKSTTSEKCGLTDVEAGFTDVETGLTDVEAGLTDVEAGLTDVKAGLTDVEAGFTDVEAGLTDVEAGLTDVEKIPVNKESEKSIRRAIWLRRKRKCINFWRRVLAFLLSTIGLTICMVFYTVFGGFVFHRLESPNEIRTKHGVRSSLKRHVALLWNLTEEMNVLYPASWSALAEQVVINYTKEVFKATKVDGWDGKEDGEADLQWSFAGSMLYSATVITTIGYGHIAPKTDFGRVATMLYALVGIPLTLLSITHMGGFMATVFRFLYKNIFCGVCCVFCRRRRRESQRTTTSMVVRSQWSTKIENEAKKKKKKKKKKKGSTKCDDEEGIVTENETVSNDVKQQLRGGRGGEGGGGLIAPVAPAPVVASATDQQRRLHRPYTIVVQWRRGIRNALFTEDNRTVQVPIYVSLLLICGYIALGAIMFGLWEQDWDFLIGSYFCFITLSTIGFGDFVPGTSLDPRSSQEKLVLCSLYLIFGLALLAMCFDLMQEEARSIFRRIGKRLGLVAKGETVPPPMDEGGAI